MTRGREHEYFLDDAASLVDGDEAARQRHAARLAADADARDLVFELEATADAIGHAGSDYEPSNDLGARVLAAIDARRFEGARPDAVTTDLAAPAALAYAAKVPSPRHADRAPARFAETAAPRRGASRAVLAAGVVAFLAVSGVAAGVFLAARHLSPTPTAPTPSGWVGMVESSWPGTDGFEISGTRNAASPSTIAVGSVLRTDERTRARLRLSDGTMMLLDQGSQLELLPGGRRVRLARGSLLADVAHVEGNQAQIETPNGTVEVLGTKFVVTASDAGTSVRVLRGKVRFSAMRSTVEVGAGEEGISAPGAAPSRFAASLPVTLRLDEETEQQDESGSIAGLGELRARRPGESSDRERPLTLADHSVKIRIAGPIARTEIEETFRNDDDVTLEGVYRFPLPQGARIASLALEVDGRWEEGSFVARERAAQIFQGVIRHATPQNEQRAREEFIWVPGPWRDPALLEWKRGGRFELRIFPIAARSSRRVRIAYEEAVPVSGSSRHYTYPLPSVRRGEATVGHFAVDVRVAGRGNVSDVRASGYPLTFARDGEASRLSFSANSFAPSGALTIDYAVDDPNAELRTFAFRGPAVAPVSPTSRDDEAVQVAQAALSADARGYVTFALRPVIPLASSTVATDYAVVVDSSQSMTGERYLRARRLVAALVQELDRRHRVTVLACDLECRSAGEVEMPSAGLASRAEAFLANIRPAGSSNLLAAISKAARALPAASERRRVVLYVGDGVASSGVTDAGTLAADARALAQASGVGITTVGIGDDADTATLSALARAGGGVHVDLTPGQSETSAALAVLETTYGVALEQPVVELPAGVELAAPAVLPTLLPGREVLISARYVGTVSGDLVVRGKLGGRPYERRIPVRLDANAGATNGFVPRTWAAARIADLELDGSRRDDAELVALSKGFGVISRSTSLLVLESPAMFSAYGVERTTGQATWDGEDADEVSSSGADDGDARASGSLSGSAFGGAGAGPSVASRAGAMRASSESDSESARPSAAPAPATTTSLGDSNAATGRVEPREMERRRTPPSQMPGRWMRVMWVRDANIAATTDVGSRDLGAVATARAARDANHDSRDRTRDLVRSLARAGLLDEALREVERWLDRDPNDVDALVFASDVYGRMGRGDEAARVLSGAADADPSDAAMAERLALAFERLGKTDQGCAFRMTLAGIRTTDEPAQRVASACASRLDLATARASYDTRAGGLARRGDGSVVTGDVERARGELLVEGSFSGADLDISVITPRGERASVLGGVRGVTVSGASSTSAESLGLRSARSGSYYIEVSRHGRGDGPIAGELRIRALGTSRTVPFVLRGDRVTVARVDLTRRRVLVNP